MFKISAVMLSLQILLVLNWLVMEFMVNRDDIQVQVTEAISYKQVPAKQPVKNPELSHQKHELVLVSAKDLLTQDGATESNTFLQKLDRNFTPFPVCLLKENDETEKHMAPGFEIYFNNFDFSANIKRLEKSTALVLWQNREMWNRKIKARPAPKYEVAVVIMHDIYPKQPNRSSQQTEKQELIENFEGEFQVALGENKLSALEQCMKPENVKEEKSMEKELVSVVNNKLSAPKYEVAVVIMQDIYPKQPNRSSQQTEKQELSKNFKGEFQVENKQSSHEQSLKPDNVKEETSMEKKTVKQSAHEQSLKVNNDKQEKFIKNKYRWNSFKVIEKTIPRSPAKLTMSKDRELALYEKLDRIILEQVSLAATCVVHLFLAVLWYSFLFLFQGSGAICYYSHLLLRFLYNTFMSLASNCCFRVDDDKTFILIGCIFILSITYWIFIRPYTLVYWEHAAISRRRRAQLQQRRDHFLLLALLKDCLKDYQSV